MLDLLSGGTAKICSTQVDLLEGNLTNPIGHWYYAHKLRTITNQISVDLTKAEL